MNYFSKNLTSSQKIKIILQLSVGDRRLSMGHYHNYAEWFIFMGHVRTLIFFLSEFPNFFLQGHYRIISQLSGLNGRSVGLGRPTRAFRPKFLYD